MSDLISIIVPIYKVEQYLEKCIDSILAQTYKNLEIILVDDGSPDSCGNICDRYQEKDPRIKVIHKANGGLSDARNAGLDIMTGDHVAFIDSDDWIDEQWCEKLLENMIRFSADMSLSGILKEFDATNTATLVTPEYGTEPFFEDAYSMMLRFFKTSWASWDKLYRASLFEKIRFPVGEINEDEAIVLHLLDLSSKVAFAGDVYYHYRVRTDSITTTAFHKKKLAWVKHCKDNLEFARQKHPAIVPQATARYRGSILWALREIALSAEDFREERDTLLKTLRENAAIFDKAPFSGRSDRLRYLMVKHLPFGIFKATLRLRHNA